MERMTLLDMVQNILSAMNSDEVNSIGDTVESMQVAEEIRTTFYELYGNRDMPSQKGLIQLESNGDSLAPHILKVPNGVSYIDWVKYRNFRTTNDLQYNDIHYLEPEEFIRRIVEQPMSNHGNYALVNITSQSTNMFPIATNKVPEYYTVFYDSQDLVFDSYDAEEEAWLTANNSLAWGTKFNEFNLEDDFVPPIDTNMFPHLLHEARSACFVNIKEVANSKEEQRSRRQLVRSQTRQGRTAAQKKGVFDKHDYSRKRG